MRKRYNTPHRSRVVKTRMTEEEYAEFAERLSAYNMSQAEFSIRSIAKYAFSGCGGLKRVSIVDGVESVGESAFANCTNIEEINMPDSVRRIGKDVFFGCEKLSDFVVPKGVICIVEYTFRGCNGLKHVHIPNGVRHIEGRAFADCCSLESISFPPSVKKIGEFDESVTGYRYGTHGGAFENCRALKEVNFSEGLEILGDNTFLNCISLKTIELPDGLKHIGAEAFKNCTSLQKLAIPYSVITTTGMWLLDSDRYKGYPWMGCSALEDIKYPYRFSLSIFEGTKFYTEKKRLEKGICPKCNVRLSVFNRRCPKCKKKF